MTAPATAAPNQPPTDSSLVATPSAAGASPPSIDPLESLEANLALAAETWLMIRSEENLRELSAAVHAYTTEIGRPTPTTEQIEQISAAVEHRRARSTHRVYDSAWDRFRAWLGKQPDGKTPTDPFHVAAYLAHLHAEGKSCKTIEQARSAISSKHREANWPDPTDDERVRAVTRGASRDPKRRPHQQAAPITETVFEQIKRNHNIAQVKDLRAITLISTMRDGLLRCSEASAARWGDLSIEPNGTGRLEIRRSKTDQTGEGATVYLRPETVGYINRWAFTEFHGESPPDDAHIFPVVDRTINRIIARAAEKAHLRGGYSGHSPRVGMAQDLLNRGATNAEAMHAGRWKNERQFLNYVRHATAGQNAVARHCP